MINLLLHLNSALAVHFINKFKDLAPFIELDFYDLIIHSNLIMGRTISLSRSFLKDKSLPSFTSFNQHKKFFVENKDKDTNFVEYGNYIREYTSWFEIPLKMLRDKYVMHSTESHMSCIGWIDPEQWNLQLSFFIPVNKNKDLSKIKVISFNPRRLAIDISSFLNWFLAYGNKHI